MNAVALRAAILIRRPAAVLFEALTNPREVVRHFPIERAVIDPLVGGRYELHGVANGEAFFDRGVIECFDPDRALGYTYTSSNHPTEHGAAGGVRITYQITDECGASLLQVAQENLPSEDYRRIMEQVWIVLLETLKKNLEGDGDD